MSIASQNWCQCLSKLIKAYSASIVLVKTTNKTLKFLLCRKKSIVRQKLSQLMTSDKIVSITINKLKRLSQIKVWSSDNFISKTFHMSFTVEYSSPNCLIIKTSFPIEEISKVNMTLNIVIRSISHSISEISVNRQYEIIKLFECNTTKPLLIYPLEQHLYIFISKFTKLEVHS